MTNNISLDVDSLLSTLNPSQRDAVTRQDGPCLVLAGAGSGKTKVLTSRIAHLLLADQNAAGDILAVTFTNKAAKEMKSRLSKLAPHDLVRQIWIGTFHGVCHRLLRLEIENIDPERSRNFVILDTNESLSNLKECLKALNIDDKRYPPRQILSAISELKNKQITASSFASKASNPNEMKLAQIYLKYQDNLKISNAFDFDDLLLYTVELLRQRSDRRAYYHQRFRHVLVDEFQDTNLVQYNILKYLTLPVEGERDWSGRSFSAVGDIDQSIYSWRGADYRLALNFSKDFPEASQIKLELNYRSSGNILSLANSLIENNTQRIPKTLHSTKDKGEKIYTLEAADEIEEGNFVAGEIKRQHLKFSEAAVLYRTNVQSRAIEDAFLKAKIPYKVVGGVRFYDRVEIKDPLAYLRLVYNSKDATSLKRIINSPKRGIGASTLAQIEEKANSLEISLYDALSDLRDSGAFSPKLTNAVHEFIELIDDLSRLSQELSVPELLKKIVDRTNYLRALRESNKEDKDDRIDNIYELLNVAQDFEDNSDDKTLEAFLEQVSLTSDLDELTGEDQKVTLMTVHAAKGLEFPCVFITGLEEGIFPHVRALNSNRRDDLEEERRLFYVAITRAQSRLYLTHARRRRLWGMREVTQGSRFWAELPTDELQNYWAAGEKTNAHSPRRSSSATSPKKQNPPPPDISFCVGQKVRHKNVGIGQIISILPGKKQSFYTVDFGEGVGKKIFNGANLKLVE